MRAMPQYSPAGHAVNPAAPSPGPPRETVAKTPAVPRSSGAGQRTVPSIVRRQKGRLVKNPLDSIYGTVISGFVLTVILYFVVRALQPVGAA